MNYAIPQLYVVPVGNTLPSAGDNMATLTSGKFGIFRQDYTAVAVSGGTAAGAEALMIGQGRHVSIPGLGTKRSDLIYKNNVTQWYKVPASASATSQVATFSDWVAQCGEDISVTLRLRSQYIDTIWANGLTRSVTVKTPCCDCGADPCETVDAPDLVASLVEAINAEPTLSQFVTASATGGDNDILTITAKALTPDPTRADPSAFPFRHDRVYFGGWAYQGPPTTQDLAVDNSCTSVAEFVITAESTYQLGTPASVRQLEKWYFGYNTTMRDQFIDTNFNGAFESQVSDSTNYDLYYIEFWETEAPAFTERSRQKNLVILAIPTTLSSAIEAILAAYHKAFANGGLS